MRLRKRVSCAPQLYRLPLRVQRIIVYESGVAYPVCPQCECTLDREYQSFCDRCGQRLSWEKLKSASVIMIKKNRS